MDYESGSLSSIPGLTFNLLFITAALWDATARCQAEPSGNAIVVGQMATLEMQPGISLSFLVFFHILGSSIAEPVDL